jgi:putative membrane protein
MLLLSNTTLQPSAATLIFVFIIVLFVFCVIYGIYVSAYIKRYYYDATDSYVTIKKGVFAPAEIHVQYAKIQDVYVDQDILDKIMGLYDVHLASATVASGIEAHIDGVDKEGADGLKNLLLQKLQGGGSVSPAYPIPASGAPVTFEKEMSNNTYPITGAWFVQQAIFWLVGSVIISGVIALMLTVPGKNGSPSIMDQFSLTSGSLWTVFFVAFVIIYALILIYSALWRSTYSFSFLPDYIVTKKGVIAKTENHLPYRAVQDVSVSQGIIERMLGIATVKIENAATAQRVGRQRISSAILIPGQPLAKANELSESIKNISLTKNSSQTGV